MLENGEFWLICSTTLMGFGVFSGLIAGMFGGGGGVVLVPGFLLIFHLFDLTDLPMHVAIATSLGNIVFTSVRSALSHHRRGNIDLVAVRAIIPGIVVGSVFGAFLADHFSTDRLQLFFAVMMLILSVTLFFRPMAWRDHLPYTSITSTLSVLIGIISSLIGIGGGSLVVPILNLFGRPMIRAIGSAAAIGIAVAVAASISFIITGWQSHGLPPLSLGYIWLPGMLLTAIPSVLIAPLGSHLASILPTARLRMVFAIFLILVSIKLGLEAVPNLELDL
ncbi:MAG: sulfite exporter TauE/SafE family protein [Alphaproteobacteria bacterium]|nr:sulfite exporter TauE/SafE family protein [Alphaproteobacteria bacterium]